MDKRRGQARPQNPPIDVDVEDISGSLIDGLCSEFARNEKDTLLFSQLALDRSTAPQPSILGRAPSNLSDASSHLVGTVQRERGCIAVVQEDNQVSTGTNDARK